MNVDKDYESEWHIWGVSESPLIVDDKVICSPGGKKTSIGSDEEGVNPPLPKLKTIMLYDYSTSLKIVLRIYEYLQVRATKIQPRTIKMNKPLHRSTVVSFLGSLPPSAGADFIWDFLLFQFHVYSYQEHELKPMPSWFMGKEAWKRWKEYSEEAKWHAKEWAREKGLKNPVASTNY